MTKKLKVGVVGAGVFGGYHAGKCAVHPRINFTGIYDPNAEKCSVAADKHGTAAFTEYANFLTSCEAIILAAPASQHGHMALLALEAGCHVLIEKPIADNMEQARQIVKLASQRDLIVQVGHQERFVLKAIGLDKVSETPIHIRGHRRSPYSPRGTDVSVTLDLMTHDLDLVLWLMNADPTDISGQSQCVKSETPDQAEARLVFERGAAILEASRVAEVSSRQMTLTYPSGTVEIDFNAKTITHDTDFDLDPNFGETPMARDSLGAATNAFVEAVLDGKPVPITGGNGLRALSAALKVDGEL